MFGFIISVPHQYIYAVMSALHIAQSLGLESTYVSMAFSIAYVLLAIKKA